MERAWFEDVKTRYILDLYAIKLLSDPAVEDRSANINRELRKSHFSIILISGRVSPIIRVEHGMHCISCSYGSRIIRELTP